MLAQPAAPAGCASLAAFAIPELHVGLLNQWLWMDITRLEKFDLTYPGHWIAGPDRDWASETAQMLSLAESEFIEAVASFAMFEPVTATNVKQSLHITRSKYKSCLNSIYARAFVYSLNTIRMLLNKLQEHFNPPDAAKVLISEYDNRFRNLKHIRDSSVHIEDRGRGIYRRKGKEHEVQSTVIVLGCFSERRFDFTGEDGRCYGEEISESTLLLAHRILQAIINAYNWE